MIKNLYFINGLYDILCSLCVLNIINIPVINNLHKNMIKNEYITKIFIRFYGYLILLNGIIRVSNNYNIIKISYLLEALYYMNEINKNTLNKNKGYITIILSLIIFII